MWVARVRRSGPHAVSARQARLRRTPASRSDAVTEPGPFVFAVTVPSGARCREDPDEHSNQLLFPIPFPTCSSAIHHGISCPRGCAPHAPSYRTSKGRGLTGTLLRQWPLSLSDSSPGHFPVRSGPTLIPRPDSPPARTHAHTPIHTISTTKAAALLLPLSSGSDPLGCSARKN
jgi:hypothetical protein